LLTVAHPLDNGRRTNCWHEHAERIGLILPKGIRTKPDDMDCRPSSPVATHMARFLEALDDGSTFTPEPARKQIYKTHVCDLCSTPTHVRDIDTLKLLTGTGLCKTCLLARHIHLLSYLPEFEDGPSVNLVPRYVLPSIQSEETRMPLLTIDVETC
jgi:hypothetical protein